MTESTSVGDHGRLVWVPGESQWRQRQLLDLPNQFSSLLTIGKKIVKENLPNPDLNRVSDFCSSDLMVFWHKQYAE
jgi:hypothetical protein